MWSLYLDFNNAYLLSFSSIILLINGHWCLETIFIFVFVKKIKLDMHIFYIKIVNEFVNQSNPAFCYQITDIYIILAHKEHAFTNYFSSIILYTQLWLKTPLCGASLSCHGRIACTIMSVKQTIFLFEFNDHSKLRSYLKRWAWTSTVMSNY